MKTSKQLRQQQQDRRQREEDLRSDYVISIAYHDQEIRKRDGEPDLVLPKRFDVVFCRMRDGRTVQTLARRRNEARGDLEHFVEQLERYIATNGTQHPEAFE